MTSAPALFADGLRRSYDERVVVESFSATVEAGETVVLVGPNGCGKSTSVEMSLGLRRADAGRAYICGHDVHEDGRRASTSVGVALQGASLNGRVRVREHLQFFAALFGDGGEVVGLANQLGLDAQVLGSLYGSLSGGQQRRVLVAAALASRPALAVLDEPTSGVDIESRIELWAALRDVQSRTGTGYLITTHDLGEAEQYADRVLVMRHGQVVFAGAPSGLICASGPLIVTTLRSSQPLDRELFRHPNVSELWASPREICLGFRSGVDVDTLRRWVAKPEQRGVTLLERTPSFEDAYLSQYGGAGDNSPALVEPIGVR